jgi:RNA polymerase-binding protein DksA
MTQSQLQRYQQRLIALRDRLLREDRELRDEAMQPTGGEASGGLSNAPIHSADMGTHEYEEEMALRLMDNAEQILAEVNAALERTEKGTFGECEDCHKKISAKRLKSVPYARYCVACETKKELEAAT